MISALDALLRLKEGNRRFVTEGLNYSPATSQARRDALVGGQEPFAIVLGCADSRVPAEIVFDQDLGELFVIRVAGNIAAASQLGSIEYAVGQLGTRLIVVLGHSHCGAVSAGLATLKNPAPLSPNLQSILDHIQPAIKPLLTHSQQDEKALVTKAVRANITAVAQQLRNEPELKNLIADDGLMVVGAEYALETGQVDFFEGVPEQE